MKGFITVLLLICSNTFMTLAWYGHLKLKVTGKLAGVSLVLVILMSWGIALFEYMFQVPANRIGFNENGGPFSLWQLKVIQEVVTLTVFTGFMFLFFKNQPLRWNHLAAFVLLIGAVYLMFRE
ncbi:MAG: DMT family protein [Chitinophagaceae bacterium]|nr:DMT family protein [Chitinophagaceae bacterium]